MKIIVHPLLPTGNFLNCRIGVERDYPDDFNLEQAINTEWDNLIAIHMKRYPHLYNEKGEPLYEKIPQDEEFRGTTLRDIKEEKPKDALGGFVEAITTCTTIKALETFKKLVEMQNVPELYEAYSETKKRLDNEQH